MITQFEITTSGGNGQSKFNPPNGNAILLFGDVGDTSYDSLQIKAETKTAKHGLYALLAYTWSHTFDNGLSDGLGSLLSKPYFPLPNWRKLDWALSQIDLRNSFVASVIYDLPFGRGKAFGSDWNNVTNILLGGYQVTVIERISSGFPDPLIDSFNQAGAYGISPRCTPTTAPCADTDFSVIKQFPLPKEMGLNFRAEFFNLFNHAQFGLPINDINAVGFGAVNSTVNNPRLVQFALKLTF